MTETIGTGPAWASAIGIFAVGSYFAADYFSKIAKARKDFKEWNGDKSEPEGNGGAKQVPLAFIESIVAGEVSAEQALKLGYRLAGERFENAPPPSASPPEGREAADEFVRDFVRLATSKNERERRAAALEAEGKGDEAYALLAELAQEEAALAAERWKSAGLIAFNDRTAKAVDAYERAVGCDPDDADAHNRLGQLYSRIGDLDRAAAAFERVLALGNQSADKIWIAAAAGNLGIVAGTRGDLDGAARYHEQALALHRELGRKEGMAINYGNLGTVAFTRGDLDGAARYFEQSLALHRELGQKEGMAANYANLGAVAQTRGDMAEACRLWRLSHDLYTEVGARPMIEQVGGWLREAGCPDAPPAG